MSDSEIQDVVTEMKSPAKFKILDVIKDRSFPIQEVDIFIDEETAYAAASLDAEIKKLNDESDKSVSQVKELKEITEKRDALIEQREALVKQIGGNCYKFTITGISEGTREDLLKLAMDKYPMEYRADTNAFSGEKTREEIESPERDKLFTELLWQKHIKKITAPDGAVQDGVSVADVSELRRSLPIAATGKLTEAIEKIRTATAVFMFSSDEDFLAKS
jgi:hypothetical protein